MVRDLKRFRSRRRRSPRRSNWRQLRRWGVAETALPGWQHRPLSPVLAVGTLSNRHHCHGQRVGTAVGADRKPGVRATSTPTAEVDSRRHLAAMAHLDRRAAMGELATSLAHELNQPLNAILQNAGVAKMLLSANTPAARTR